MPFHPDGRPYTIDELMKAAGAKTHSGPSRTGPVPEGFVTPYQFSKLVNTQPQHIYGLTKRDATFPCWRDPNSGRIVVPVAEALAWWTHKNPPPTIVDKPYLAFRTFTLDNGRLRSYSHEFTWNEGEPTKASCPHKNREHEAPNRKCSCGLYALRTANEVNQQFAAHIVRGDGVYAAVALWGHVINGYDEGKENEPKGYRGQYGQIVALLCDNWRRADVLHRVAQRHKCPVTHSMKLFAGTNWVDQWNTTVDLAATLGIEGGETIGHWGEGEGDDRASITATLPGALNTGTAACRTAAAGAGSLEQLRYLWKEGTISFSNIEELMGGGEE